MKKVYRSLVARYRIPNGKKFRLDEIDPADTGKIHAKEEAAELLADGVKRMCVLQDKLFAQDRWAVLLIFQAMDAAGKDGTIKHVMTGVNPQGCQVSSFKAPSATELDHDYLWRANVALPERGRIGIFNRSYYEEVLVVRVHPELLKAQRLPDALIGKHFWRDRFEDVNAYERYLSRNGIVIVKFFLHVSKGEQRKRFLSRLEEPEKNWKFSAADARERGHWDKYQDVYEKMIRHTATKHAPWHVIPADNKWFTRLVVAATIVEKLESLHLQYPKVEPAKRKDLDAARAALLAE
ncbi:MAG TPA: polyphosphate kinase 2 family protein [Chthoniobacteraceae bacterium]